MDYFNYSQYSIAQKQELENKEKEEALKERISSFKTVSTLEDAKNLAKEIIPTNQEVTSFYVGNAKCVVVNKVDSLRITMDTNKEFICYDFS